MAVQACEAAVASISRPSSPVESSNSQIPEKEMAVRLRLEEHLDQVNFRNIAQVKMFHLHVIVMHCGTCFYKAIVIVCVLI